MLVSGADAVSRLIAIAILISQPLYIVALWGVGLLKKHARGIHDLAKSMRDAATVDALTGIANRRAIDHVLESVTHEVSQARRDLAVLMFDVDHFKRINDSYGHATGDQVLVRLAQEAGRHLRKSDLLSRWGGEEFMVIALDQSGPMALQMAERLRSELEMTVFSSVGQVTISIGVTSYVAGESVDTCIERADKALYLAKENGRNRVEGIFAGDETR
jgi:diguanylate cyclase (GGDEF)-like protein